MADLPLYNWLDKRAAGVLLHPTCLPGDQGIGTFDGRVGRFLDFLQEAGMRYWQICSLGPTGYGDSPYQCFSAFAGNPYLIDLHALEGIGLLKPEETAPLAAGESAVAFGELYRFKWPLLRRAFDRYARRGFPPLGDETFEAFKARTADWLEPYALFRALKDVFGGRAWTQWPPEARRRETAAASRPGARLARRAEAHKFFQYAFFAQWRRVRAEARRRGISIIGDLPIFVAADSADVWSRPELFELDQATGMPTAAAGVPPDYFSAEGQFWGNPLYVWERHAADGYAWWRSRMTASFELYDVVRIDHFRGFDEYWRVQLPAKNAIVGAWLPGPGLSFFAAIRKAFPGARIIAEDLGAYRPTLAKLREETGLPGMAVLQFAFGGDAENAHLPHNLTANSVVYSGTHDNDTTLGWYASADEKTRDHVRRYLRVDGREIGWDLIRAAYGAVSRLAVIPLQDILGLGSEGRMNTPAKPEGNWRWRFQDRHFDRLSGRTAGYLRELGWLTGRCR